MVKFLFIINTNKFIRTAEVNNIETEVVFRNIYLQTE